VKGLKVIAGLIGLGITVGAWLISHHERFPFVERVLTPKYSMAMTALNRMHQKGNVMLKSGEVGFAEISETLKEDIQRREPIAQIRKVNSGQAVIETAIGIESQHFFDLELSFRDGPLLKERFYGVQAKIQKKYLDSPLFRWDSYIFATGVFITVMSLLL
jgi:hypothetical protein